tara:strand:- start:161 stop:547 length:387 start_codon:yes stop_codon:yes gene_type:complete
MWNIINQYPVEGKVKCPDDSVIPDPKVLYAPVSTSSQLESSGSALPVNDDVILHAQAFVIPPAGTAAQALSPRKKVLELAVPVADKSASTTESSGKPPAAKPEMVPLVPRFTFEAAAPVRTSGDIRKV